jgi:hypothetical protein
MRACILCCRQPTRVRSSDACVRGQRRGSAILVSARPTTVSALPRYAWHCRAEHRRALVSVARGGCRRGARGQRRYSVCFVGGGVGWRVCGALGGRGAARCRSGRHGVRGLRPGVGRRLLRALQTARARWRPRATPTATAATSRRCPLTTRRPAAPRSEAETLMRGNTALRDALGEPLRFGPWCVRCCTLDASLGARYRRCCALLHRNSRFLPQVGRERDARARRGRRHSAVRAARADCERRPSRRGASRPFAAL